MTNALAVAPRDARGRYKTDLSSWEFPTPASITDNEAKVDALWLKLDGLAAAKQMVRWPPHANKPIIGRLNTRTDNW